MKYPNTGNLATDYHIVCEWLKEKEAEIDRLKETNKKLLERLALLEKKIPQLTVDLAQASTCAYTSETARLQLIEIINGMFPMWIAAMSFCEHGKHDSLMRMRNYYNGRDNLLTSDQIHVMFSLIRGVGDERK